MFSVQNPKIIFTSLLQYVDLNSISQFVNCLPFLLHPLTRLKETSRFFTKCPANHLFERNMNFSTSVQERQLKYLLLYSLPMSIHYMIHFVCWFDVSSYTLLIYKSCVILSVIFQ